MTDTQSISIRVNKKHLEYIKKMSHYLSLERNEDISYVDLIREALEKEYPLPKDNESKKVKK